MTILTWFHASNNEFTSSFDVYEQWLSLTTGSSVDVDFTRDHQGTLAQGFWALLFTHVGFLSHYFNQLPRLLPLSVEFPTFINLLTI